jgi:crossover junction endodeoxyribonuclease RuvC
LRAKCEKLLREVVVRVLGIDCGSEFTGYGVVDQDADSTLICVTHGAVALNRNQPLALRLAAMFNQLNSILEHHRPDAVAIEDVFYAVNAKSALKLGQVRGVALLAAALHGCPIAEYAPLSIKSAVVGYGRAEKQQVQQMVARLLALKALPQSFDAADALAIAICHLHTNATERRIPATAGRR